MARRWGKVDYRQLKKLQERMQKLEKIELEKFCEAMAKELAARLLAKAIKRTPVGQYDDGRVGGTLRRGWTVGKITKKGNIYEIEVFNPVEYAMYVEYGHRTRNHTGWVPGRFMMTISADELQKDAPKIIEKKLIKLLGDAMNGN